MLLDTFTILFESNTDDVKKGLADTQKQADSTASSIGSAIRSVAGLAAAFLAAGAAQARFSETVDELNAIGIEAEKLGLKVEDVDSFGRSILTIGGDAGSARGSLKAMAEALGEANANLESGKAKAFKALGVDLRDMNGGAIDATEGMLRLSDALAGMSKDQALFRLKEIGINDPKTIELMLKGRKEMERMMAAQKAQSAVTKDSVDLAKTYHESIGRLRNAQDSIATQMVVALIPAVTKVIDWIAKGVEWMRENSQTVTAFFGAIAAVVMAVYLPAMLSAAAATIAATWPLILAASIVGVLSAAFALLYDDIQNFLSGNDSLIGQISEKFPIVGEIVTTVADAIGQAWAGVKGFIVELWDAIAPLSAAFGDVFGAIGSTIGAFLSLFGTAVKQISGMLGFELSDSFTTAGAIIGGVMNGIVAVVRAAVSFLTGAFSVISKVVSGVGSAVSTVSGWLGGDNVAGDVEAGNKAIGGANESPLNNTTSAAISNSTKSVSKETNVQVGEVVVNTQATDAGGISRDISGSLNGQLKSLDTEFASGVDR